MKPEGFQLSEGLLNNGLAEVEGIGVPLAFCLVELVKLQRQAITRKPFISKEIQATVVCFKR